MGNRIRKQTNDPNAAAKILIVDIAGELPIILCEIDDFDGSLTNSYFYGSNARLYKWADIFSITANISRKISTYK
jgi:hypothetical protein